MADKCKMCEEAIGFNRWCSTDPEHCPEHLLYYMQVQKVILENQARDIGMLRKDLATAHTGYLAQITQLQQAVQNHITWNEAHTKARVELTNENAELKEEIEIANHCIDGFREMCEEKDNKVLKQRQVLEMAREALNVGCAECPSWYLKKINQCPKCCATSALTAINEALGGNEK